MTVATKKLLLDVREAGESILQHTSGYDTVDDAVVWGVVEKHLPSLIKEVTDLLESA